MADVYGTNGPDNRSGTDSGEYLYGYGGDDTLDGKGGGDILFGHDGNDRLYGGGGTDWFYGGNGSDTLYGGDHNDVYWAALEGDGDDTFHGDGGYDTVDYSGAATGVVIALHLDKAGNTALGNDKLHWVENAAGGEHNDIIHGTDWSFLGIAGWGDNTLYGRGGHDNIYGRSGDDKLYGGAGFDMLNGGDGADQLYGGDEDGDSLYSNNDNDKLYGEGGNDRLNGGLGDDHLDGGAGYDTATYADATSAVDMVRNTQGNDTFANIEGVVGSTYDDWLLATDLPPNAGYTLDGGRGHDHLYGADAKDTLIGGDGNDGLEGRAGVDFLIGGAGQDRFAFRQAGPSYNSGAGPANRDAIGDFQHGVDIMGIYTDRVKYGAPPPPPVTFIGQGAFTHARQARFGFEDGDTIVQVNMDTDFAAEFEIELYGSVTLTQSDFHFLHLTDITGIEI